MLMFLSNLQSLFGVAKLVSRLVRAKQGGRASKRTASGATPIIWSSETCFAFG